jgi:hypothetical protein
MAAQGVSEADEVARRAAVFRARVAEHHARGRAGAPVLTLLDTPPPGDLPPVRPGRCISCDAALDAAAPGRTWRCTPCLRAVEQVLDLG